MPLTNDQQAALLAEIRDDPASRGYALAASPDAVWDLICLGTLTPGTTRDVPAPVTRAAAVNALPWLFQAEIALRESANGGDAEAETALAYWLGADSFDAGSGLGGLILDAMKATPEQRAEVAALCVAVEKDPDTLEEPRRLVIFGGRPLGSLADVTAALASLGR